MSPLRIVWSWRARAIASGLAVVSAAVTVWAAIDPRTSAWTAIGGGLLAGVTALMALETYVYRVDGDAAGLRRRSLRGTDTLAWAEIRGVQLVDSRDTGLAIVHTPTRDLGAAFHLRLITELRGPAAQGSSLPGPASRRPWKFNAWMRGYDELRGLAAERGWPVVVEPPVREGRWVALVLLSLAAINELGSQLVWGFALFFMLFMASLAIVSEVEPTGNFWLDLVLVASALLGVAGLVDVLIKRYGGRREAQEDAGDGERRALWMAHAASLIGGALFLVMFVPRALAGGPGVEWFLVGLGVLGLIGALRP